MKRTALLVSILAVFIFAPNLVWLAYSTNRITNGGAGLLRSVTVHVDDRKVYLGELHPGDSRFTFLPKSGDATYRVSYTNGTRDELACQAYVEGEMYHVELLLADTRGPVCTVTLPLISELFILKLI